MVFVFFLSLLFLSHNHICYHPKKGKGPREMILVAQAQQILLQMKVLDRG
jgi:hypothetical protein